MKANRGIVARLAFAASAALSLALGACVAPVQAPIRITVPFPDQLNANHMPRAETFDWHDMPATPGVWSWRREGGLSVAWFGDSSAPGLLSLTCHASTASITISRSDAPALATSMSILTTSLSRDVGVRSQGNGRVATTLSARDPLLDAMAFSRGRFAVKLAGTEPLYVPSWPEVARVVEDCR